MGNSAPIEVFDKDPDAKKVYGVNWEPWLTNEGDTILTSTWICLKLGIALSGITAHDETSTSVTVEGGTIGEQYLLTNRITTVQGSQDDQSIAINIKQQ